MTLPLIFALSACKVVDAPDNLQELMAFSFTSFDDPRALEAAAEEVLGLVEASEADLEDGMRIDSLMAEDIAAAGVEGAEVEDGIMGAVGLVRYRHRMEPVLDAVTWPHKEDFLKDTVSYEVRSDTDRRCFLDAECERYEIEATEVTKVSLLGEATRELEQVLVRVGTDDVPMTFQRTLVPGGVAFNSDLMKVHQQYGVMVLWDQDGAAHRLEAFWVDAEIIGLDVPDSFAVDQAVLSMRNYSEQIDVWLDER